MKKVIKKPYVYIAYKRMLPNHTPEVVKIFDRLAYDKAWTFTYKKMKYDKGYSYFLKKEFVTQ